MDASTKAGSIPSGNASDPSVSALSMSIPSISGKVSSFPSSAPLPCPQLDQGSGNFGLSPVSHLDVIFCRRLFIIYFHVLVISHLMLLLLLLLLYLFFSIYYF